VPIGKVGDDGKQRFGCLDLRQVAGVRQQLEAGPWDGGRVGPAVVDVPDPVRLPQTTRAGVLTPLSRPRRVGSCMLPP
jgi:hypothetical protein